MGRKKQKENEEELSPSEDFAYLPVSQTRPKQDKREHVKPNKPEPLIELKTEDGRKLGTRYLAPPPDFDLNFTQQVPYAERVKNGMKSNPLVPLGLGVTVFALCYGVYQMRIGDSYMSQRMMKLRVSAQIFTIVALMTGSGYEAYKQVQKNKAKKLKELTTENNSL